MNEKLRGLYNVIEANSVRDFLCATPYPAGGQSSEIDRFFDKNREVFFDELYVPSLKEAAEFCDIDRRIKQRHNNLILVSGYKGCGKTTFIHKYVRHLKEKNIRYIFYNFDSYGNTDPIRYTIARYINNAIYRDIVDNNGVACNKWVECVHKPVRECLPANFTVLSEIFFYKILYLIKKDHLHTRHTATLTGDFRYSQISLASRRGALLAYLCHYGCHTITP